MNGRHRARPGRPWLRQLIAFGALPMVVLAVLACNPGVRTPAGQSVHMGHTVDSVGISLAGQVIEETDPRWDCRVNGNRECGPGGFEPDATLDPGQVSDQR